MFDNIHLSVKESAEGEVMLCDQYGRKVSNVKMIGFRDDFKTSTHSDINVVLSVECFEWDFDILRDGYDHEMAKPELDLLLDGEVVNNVRCYKLGDNGAVNIILMPSSVGENGEVITANKYGKVEFAEKPKLIEDKTMEA